MRVFMALVAALALQAGPPARFDVASIKPNQSGPTGTRTLTLVPGGLRVINLPLSAVPWMAHGVQQDQIVDIPSWAKDEAFDITAKGSNVTPETFQPMLVALLADRFQLKTHHEMRELPVYRLLRVDERSLGPNLQLADYDCAALATAATRQDSLEMWISSWTSRRTARKGHPYLLPCANSSV